MLSNLKVRFLLIAGLALLSGWLLYQRGITLGLDLQGGTHLALEVADPDGTFSAEERANLTDQALYVIRTRINELGVTEPVIQRAGNDRIIVQLPGIQDEGRAKEIIQENAFLEFQIVRPLDELLDALPRIDRAIVGALGPDAFAAAEPAEAAPGVEGLFEAAPNDEEGDTAAVAAGAAADTAIAARPLTSTLQPTGALGQFAVAEEDVEAVERYLALPEVQRLIPRGTELLWGLEIGEAAQEQPFSTLYFVEADPLVTGEFLEDAQALRDPQFGQPVVTFELSRQGGRIFERGTGQHLGDFMAIVLDEQVFSAPIIEGQIGSNGQITMTGGSIEEARDLALVLRAGALPAPIQVVEERTIGPSLGADSIEQGRIAGIIGLVLVVVIMIGYYRLSGVMAVTALALYVLFVMGGLSGIGATLTLPGIAGLILSIGMAVDANVLIFERIREELEVGRSPRVAVSEGFGNALSAIVDGQLTTLLTALVLFQFGTGPVRGFAVTLGIGIIASLFSAIFITRTFYMLYLDRRGAARELSI